METTHHGERATTGLADRAGWSTYPLPAAMVSQTDTPAWTPFASAVLRAAGGAVSAAVWPLLFLPALLRAPRDVSEFARVRFQTVTWRRGPSPDCEMHVRPVWEAATGGGAELGLEMMATSGGDVVATSSVAVRLPGRRAVPWGTPAVPESPRCDHTSRESTRTVTEAEAIAIWELFRARPYQRGDARQYRANGFVNLPVPSPMLLSLTMKGRVAEVGTVSMWVHAAIPAGSVIAEQVCLGDRRTRFLSLLGRDRPACAIRVEPGLVAEPPGRA